MGRSLLLTVRFFTYIWSFLLTVNWLGLLNIRLQSGGKIGFVPFCLLSPHSENGLSSILAVPRSKEDKA